MLSRQVVLGPSARRPQWDLIVVMVHLTPNRSCLWAICGLTGSLFTVVKADRNSIVKDPWQQKEQQNAG